jgi:hypothetical protein
LSPRSSRFISFLPYSHGFSLPVIIKCAQPASPVSNVIGRPA